MLSHSLLKNHAGIMLIGDYSSLRWVHDTVHSVNENSILIENKEGLFLGLAYDVRKAFERQREILPPPKRLEEIGTRFGVRILWPTILLQQRMRASLAWFEHSRCDQAVCYALEAVIDEAIRNDFQGKAESVLARWQRLDPSQPGVFERLQSRGAVFSSWKKAERRNRFPELLDSFDPLYERFYAMRVRHGETGLVPPAEFERREHGEWADPFW